MMTEVWVAILLIVINHIASSQLVVSVLRQSLSELFAEDKRHHSFQIVLLCSRQAVQRTQRTLYLWMDITIKELSLLWALQQHIGLQ